MSLCDSDRAELDDRVEAKLRWRIALSIIPPNRKTAFGGGADRVRRGA